MSTTDLSLNHGFREGSAESPVLLLLHGTGGSPQDLVGLGQEISPESTLLAPAGPVSENGAARWFRRRAEGVFDTEDVIARTHQLADFLEEARQHYGLGTRRLVAVGFSNGANIAAALTLLRPQALQEAILFAAMLPVPEPPAHDLAGTRVFLSNGERDPMAPMQPVGELVTALEQRGARVRSHRHPGGHQITREGLQEAVQWFRHGSAGAGTR
ncbi:phospholipase/carboxylesterase [Halopolyspora algeriensis]|uniref:Phospholipase/carboxylesterase n=1 Tax=Halopolyspora algeriensis TaxID=1500506 RepID=A0A368VQR8_9ACTN|nr:alpha/beta hydrolase [Halopolyspora algeriensis]RCW42807.1 phospholipase/carboxylesterase [Halopolyspora algeriensis]TQM56723.1 phospholipase/carboxylesterase [Halopolyspora algeriensis]